jgi:hypothetical protein
MTPMFSAVDGMGFWPTTVDGTPSTCAPYFHGNAKPRRETATTKAHVKVEAGQEPDYRSAVPTMKGTSWPSAHGATTPDAL